VAFRSASARPPSLIAASGDAAVETVRGVRELRPGLPAIVVAGDSEVPRLLAAFADEPVVLLRSPVDPGELALAIHALLEAPASPRTTDEDEEATGAALLSSKGSGEPRSYAHLAGLLPRALERTIDFDVAAAVIARPGAEPLVDVHVTSQCDDQTLQLVHDRALALFRLIVGGAHPQEEVAKATAPCSLRSSLHVPLATEGRVVGLTYLASFRENAFSATEERVLAALAAHASGAYRRLEASLRRLRLTPRQAQVLALIASGLSDKEVASRLGLAHRTVRTHLDRLLREHGLHSRTEAVAAWLRGKQD
jgi:DNA-binding NarL/FixJ family response regulator